LAEGQCDQIGRNFAIWAFFHMRLPEINVIKTQILTILFSISIIQKNYFTYLSKDPVVKSFELNFGIYFFKSGHTAEGALWRVCG
jgi:hypothetical protein